MKIIPMQNHFSESFQEDVDEIFDRIEKNQQIIDENIFKGFPFLRKR